MTVGAALARISAVRLAAVVLSLGAVAATAVAQRSKAPRNDLPQPYRTTRDWGELPPGMKWAAVTAVEPAPDGTHLRRSIAASRTRAPAAASRRS